MCLASPAKIISIDWPNAVCEIRGVQRRANIAFIESPAEGDYVLLHAGFAIRKWTEEDVAEYNAILAEAGEATLPEK